MKTQAMKIYFHKVLKAYHTEEKCTYSEEMGSGSLEFHFIELKRYEVKKKKKTGSCIMLFLEVLHTGDERLEQLKFGRQLK